MARKKRKNSIIEENEMLRHINDNNIVALNQPNKRTYSIHDLKSLKPFNEAQRSLIESYFTGNKTIADGSAGTGKTYISAWLALNSLLSKDEPQDKIIIIRSAVASRDVGFLPGDINEKLEPYELPYKDIFACLLNRKFAYDDLKAEGKLQFMPTSYLRGLTWDNTIILIDEIQNMTFHEIDTIITRIGMNSRLLICGDYNQNDLVSKRSEQSGVIDFLKIAKLVPEFDIISFTRDDIVRSSFVKSWICAKEDAKI